MVFHYRFVLILVINLHKKENSMSTSTSEFPKTTVDNSLGKTCFSPLPFADNTYIWASAYIVAERQVETEIFTKNLAR